ncbi:hypothetical protein [Campylobacter iguaniorum]|uniref:hypothetical protein n=1 Tax=Campylobacter iguaniorum TaxID=1244531 RepID=UPI000ABED9AB|nr:hypothetical protein [Campylobacter iguaniorum]
MFEHSKLAKEAGLQMSDTVVTYDDIKNIAKRYDANCDEVIAKLSAAQANFFKAITK